MVNQAGLHFGSRDPMHPLAKSFDYDAANKLSPHHNHTHAPPNQSVQYAGKMARLAADNAAMARQATNLAAFNVMASITPMESQQKTLRERMLATMLKTPTRRPPEETKKSTSSSRASHSDDNPLLSEAAMGALTVLRKTGRESARRQLDEQYDPLQQYALLDKAGQMLEKAEFSPNEKVELKAAVDGLMADLMKSHRDDIRSGLKDTQAMEMALASMADSGDAHPASLRELRFLYGSKGKGNFDAPLTPLGMARVLEQKFGAASFANALSGLRSKMAENLRPSEGSKLSGPRLWLSMHDAQAFNMVQSCFAIASDFRRELGERAHILPKTTPAAMTVTLLSLGEKGKVSHLIAEVLDPRTATALSKALVYPMVLQTVRNLPMRLWQERPAQRNEIIDELQRYVLAAHKGMPTQQTQVERREEQWREALGRKQPSA